MTKFSRLKLKNEIYTNVLIYNINAILISLDLYTWIIIISLNIGYTKAIYLIYKEISIISKIIEVFRDYQPYILENKV